MCRVLESAHAPIPLRRSDVLSSLPLITDWQFYAIAIPAVLLVGISNWVGALLTTVSGFTSFVSHSGGPPLNVYVLPLRLAPIVFTATMAALFFAINLSKSKLFYRLVHIGMFLTGVKLAWDGFFA